MAKQGKQFDTKLGEPTVAAIYLQGHKTKPIAQGHPWVFPKAIGRKTRIQTTQEPASIRRNWRLLETEQIRV